MIDVAHDRDDRRTLDPGRTIRLGTARLQFLFLLELDLLLERNDEGLEAHPFRQFHREFRLQEMVHGRHQAPVEQHLQQVLRLDAHLLGQVANLQPLRDRDRAPFASVLDRGCGGLLPVFLALAAGAQVDLGRCRLRVGAGLDRRWRLHGRRRLHGLHRRRGGGIGLRSSGRGRCRGGRLGGLGGRPRRRGCFLRGDFLRSEFLRSRRFRLGLRGRQGADRLLVDDRTAAVRTHRTRGRPEARDGPASGRRRRRRAIAENDFALGAGDLLALEQGLDDVRVDHGVFSLDAHTDRTELEQQVLFGHVHPLGQVLQPDFAHEVLGPPPKSLLTRSY